MPVTVSEAEAAVAGDASVPACAVLIVGAGPAGLFAACELIRYGVRPRIVDRNPAPHHEARGTALQPAVLASLHRAGLADQFLQAGARIRQIQVLGPGLREIASEQFADAGGAFPFQCSLPQWRTETILRDHLRELGLEVEYGTEVISIEDDPSGLRVTLERDGKPETVVAGYVVGAGGAHSITRHSMQEQLGGETYGGRYFVADAKIGLPCAADCGRVIIGASGFILLSPLPGGRRLIFVTRDEDDTRDTAPGEAELARLLDARAGAELGLHDLRWVSPFRMHKRLVPRLSDGGRFLLGDAAHLSSPLGGEGLNSALMDAADIAWKLGLVIGGRARPWLLDTFAIERGLADRHVLEVSDEVHGFVMGLVAQCGAGGVPSVAEAEPAQHLLAARRRLMLDISYAGSPIIGAAGEGRGPKPGERFPGCHQLSGTSHHLITFGPVPGLDEMRAKWGELLGVVDGAQAGFDAAEARLPDGGAILVRPDGFIGFQAAPADEAAMGAVDAHLGRYMVQEVDSGVSGRNAAVPGGSL